MDNVKSLRREDKIAEVTTRKSSWVITDMAVEVDYLVGQVEGNRVRNNRGAHGKASASRKIYRSTSVYRYLILRALHDVRSIGEVIYSLVESFDTKNASTRSTVNYGYLVLLTPLSILFQELSSV